MGRAGGRSKDAAGDLFALGLFATLGVLAGCDPPEQGGVQGYVEGEFVYVASPLAGRVESLHVDRGAQVKAGDALFAFDSSREQAAVDEAERRLAQARANLADAKKGQRPTEIAAIESQLEDAKNMLLYAEREMARLSRLKSSGAATPELLDRAQSEYDRARQLVATRTAELETAQLGARPDQIAAAEAEVHAREAAVARAEWDLAQMSQAAPQAGPVFDVLYREGEWVMAGRPVVVLLPPRNVKVRAFVPEPNVGAIRVGEKAHVRMDGVPKPLTGTVSFVSPKAEFTPPVIYSRESRSKLVFLVELTFDPDAAAKLHPGQPVDVEFGP